MAKVISCLNPVMFSMGSGDDHVTHIHWPMFIVLVKCRVST